MKTTKESPTQTTASKYAPIIERTQTSSTSTQEAIFEGATEITPLLPKELQQLLQQLNWQEQDLAAAGISSTLLVEELNRSWYSRLNRWLLREPLLFKILQWPFSKKWPKGTVFPTDNEQLLKRIYGINGYLEGASLILNIWSNLVLSFMLVDIYNYLAFPHYPYRNTLLDIFLARASNEKTLSTVLIQPVAWSILLVITIYYGVIKAAASTLSQQAKPLDKDQYRTLLETLAHYQATLWKDIGRWVLPSLLPEFSSAFELKPELKRALESAERLLLWDRRISSDERRILLQQVQVLARKATYVTQSKALASLAEVADGIAPDDLVRLSQQGVGTETLQSLLRVKQQARQTLQQIAKNPSMQLPLSSNEMQPLINSPLVDDNHATPSRSRYLYTHYLLWTLGQPHNYCLQPLFMSYLAFQLYFKARSFYLLGRGIYNPFEHYWNKRQCEREGKIWSYFNERVEWNCSVCGDLPLFYNDVFDEKTCWEAYTASPRPADKLAELIKRLSFVKLPAIDLSRQHLGNEDLIAVLDALRFKANHIQTLFLNDSAFPPSPLNTTAIQVIADFLQNSAVTELSLQGRQIQAIDIQWLARALLYSPIQFLDLSMNIIGAEGAKEIGQVLNRSQVQQLDLSENDLGDKGVKEIAQGLLSSQVQYLNLGSNGISGEGAKSLAQELPNSQVKFLNLKSNQNMGYEGAKEIVQMLNRSQVQSLDLSLNNITAEGAKELALGLPGSQVLSLILSMSSMGDEDIKELVQGLPGSQVQYLDLSGNHIGAEGGKALGQILNQSQVQTLNLYRNNIGDEGVKGLAQGLPGSQVQYLYLQSNNILDEGAKSIGQVLNRLPVQTLKLRLNNISDEGAKGLARGLPGSQVQLLDLGCNKIGAEGAGGLALGLPGSKVQTLILESSRSCSIYGIGDEGATKLAQGLPGSQVQFLDLRYNGIGPKGAKGLTQGLPGSQVQYLDLSGNRIGNEGAAGLAQVLPDSHVQSLYLSGTVIDNEGIQKLANVMVKKPFNIDLINVLSLDVKKAIAHAKPNTPLEVLDLSSNFFDTQGARALCLVLPQTHINRFNLSGNGVSPRRVDPQTCFIFSSGTASFQPSGPYVTLYHLYQAAQHYAMERYQHIVAHWLTTPPSLSLAHNKAQDQFSSSLDSISNPVEEVPSDSLDFLSGELTINKAPVINDVPYELNENEPLFTLKITSTTPTATASSSLLGTRHHTSENPFGFFNTLAKTNSSVTAQPLTSLPALPKPSETLPTVSALGAVGATVTGLLAVGCWIWKKYKRSLNDVSLSKKMPMYFQP
jgi:Ran GTPase-activating protein (RanGAP) involved in mRNA processing and transport